ncbi:IS3 family transposase [Owenweeksia hongkongensis]|uniref:IS3 family transposase n=1 Tax=Owenweeksia hongkongensis TaxID=253245 RepID=UPI0038996399
MSRNSGSSKRRSQRDYNMGFKLAVISQVEKGEMTYKQAQKAYGIQGRSTVLVWLRKHGSLDWSKPYLHSMSNPRRKETPAQTIKRLERELSDERLKNEILNITIDMADKEHGISIRKKVLPKQSGRIRQQKQVSLTHSCRLFGISRQAIYQARARALNRADELAQLKPMVLAIRMRMPRLGTRKLYYLLQSDLKKMGIKIGRDAFFDYLRSEHLLIRPKKTYTKTTNSKHWLHKHPNLLKEHKVTRPEEVLVSDITYVKTRERTHYLSLVTDACSRKIMGYHLSEDMAAEQVVKALKMAMKHRRSQAPMIHHSDRGLQYCAAVYQNELQKHQVTPSMTDGYDCYQNALAERVNGILKNEFLIETCNTASELQLLIKQSIETYNNLRPHLSLNYKTPNFIHEKTLEAIASRVH